MRRGQACVSAIVSATGKPKILRLVFARSNTSKMGQGWECSRRNERTNERFDGGRIVWQTHHQLLWCHGVVDENTRTNQRGIQQTTQTEEASVPYLSLSISRTIRQAKYCHDGLHHCHHRRPDDNDWDEEQNKDDDDDKDDDNDNKDDDACLDALIVDEIPHILADGMPCCSLCKRSRRAATATTTTTTTTVHRIASRPERQLERIPQCHAPNGLSSGMHWFRL